MPVRPTNLVDVSGSLVGAGWDAYAGAKQKNDCGVTFYSVCVSATLQSV